MEIYLIRHTKPAIDSSICYGQSDVDVDDSFLPVSDAINQYLPSDVDLVVTSPLKRCMKLAKAIESNQSNLNTLLIENGFMEMDFGDWEMQHWNQIEETALHTWMSDFVNVKVPNGENFIGMFQRVVAAFELLPFEKHEKIVIVSHAGVIRCLLSYMSNLPLADTFKFEFDYGGITLVKMNNKLFNFKFVNKKLI